VVAAPAQRLSGTFERYEAPPLAPYQAAGAAAASVQGSTAAPA
jgi:hypothetical protein